MKLALIGICSLYLLSCSPGSMEVNVPVDTMHVAPQVEESDGRIVSDSVSTDDDSFAYYYIVVADTGKEYALLYEKMNTLSKALSVKVDMMDRSYNKSKDLIALPTNYDDEIYAGEYFPRRSVSDFLSLEYLNFYNQTSNEKTIALVSGIFEKEADAEVALIKLRSKEPKSFKIRGKVYIGCMH